jgi:hypothetical protein
VHLRFAAETFNVGQEVALIGTDRTAQGVVILKRGAEAEWKDGGAVKAARDHAGVITGSGLGFRTGKAVGVLMQMFGDDNGEIGCGKEEDLVSKKAGDSCERHRATVTG